MWEPPKWQQGIAAWWDAITKGNLEDRVAPRALEREQTGKQRKSTEGVGTGAP